MAAMKVYTNFLHHCPVWVAFAFIICISAIWVLSGKRIENRAMWKTVNIALLIAGVLVIAWYTMFSRIGITVQGDRIIWIPFQKETLKIPIVWTWRAIIDNVLLFMPLGLATTQLFDEKKRCLLVGMIVSLAVEIIQFTFMVGVFETEDVICNTLGYCIPWIVKGCLSKTIKITIN